MSATNADNQEIQFPEKATKDETIVDLARRNSALQCQVERLQMQLHSLNAELDKQKVLSVKKVSQCEKKGIPKKEIAKFVHYLFEGGRVPLPASMVGKNLLCNVVCRE